MAAKDLGIKYVCFKCGTKFYDLRKPEPVCPKCGADQRQSPALKTPQESRRSRLAAVPKPVEPIPVVEPEIIEEEETIEAFDDEEPDLPTEEEI